MRRKIIPRTIEGQDYDINIDRAKELGVLKHKLKIQMGDVFHSLYSCHRIVITIRADGKYGISGYLGDLFRSYPRATDKNPKTNPSYIGDTAEDIGNWLEKNRYYFVKNINQNL